MNRAQTDSLLKAMSSPEARVVFTLNEMRRNGIIEVEQAKLVRQQLAEKNQSLRIILTLAKEHYSFDELRTYIEAHLDNLKAEAEQAEEHSPMTQKKIQEVAEDTSPLGNMLKFRKQRGEDRNPEDQGFSIKLNMESM